MPSKRRTDSFRRRLIFILITVLFFFIIYRSFTLQYGKRKKFKILAERQSSRIVTLREPRGPILDRNGDDIAVTVGSYTIYAYPSKIRDKRRVAVLLSKELGIKSSNILKKLSVNRGYIPLASNIDKDVVNRILSYRIKAISFLKGYRREYPKGNLFRCVVGNTGRDVQGLCGLELYYDSILRGRRWKKGVIRDAKGNLISFDPSLEKSVVRGIKTTLDLRVGAICEEELEWGILKFQAKGGMVIVMDPSSGEIISMVSFPPCTGGGFFKSPICSKLIEPGSVIKPFILAKALEEGKVYLNTVIKCKSGKFRLAGHIINDIHPHTHDLTAREVIVESSNVGISKIALLLGAESLKELFKRLGFDERTGIDVLEDEKGLLGSFKTDLDIACKAFGQGISITLLHLATAFSAFANGGYIPRPFLVTSIVDEDGRVIKDISNPYLRKVFDAWVANTVKSVLRDVVLRGTGKRAEIPGFGICGKTGTSQKLVNGRYSRDKVYSIFVGFFPFHSPRFLIAVLVDEPKLGHYGGEVAAPIFRRIAKRIIAYYGLSPEVVVSSNIVVRNQVVRKERKVKDNNRFPDLRGLTLREALRILDNLHVDVKIIGYRGVVTDQDPKPGSSLGSKSCILYLGERE